MNGLSAASHSPAYLIWVHNASVRSDTMTVAEVEQPSMSQQATVAERADGRSTDHEAPIRYDFRELITTSAQRVSDLVVEHRRTVGCSRTQPAIRTNVRTSVCQLECTMTYLRPNHPSAGGAPAPAANHSTGSSPVWHPSSARVSATPTRFLLVTLHGCCPTCNLFRTDYRRAFEDVVEGQRVMTVWCAEPSSTRSRPKDPVASAPIRQVVCVAASVKAATRLVAQLRRETSHWDAPHALTVAFARPGCGPHTISASDFVVRADGSIGLSWRALTEMTWQIVYAPERRGRCVRKGRS